MTLRLTDPLWLPTDLKPGSEEKIILLARRHDAIEAAYPFRGGYGPNPPAAVSIFVRGDLSGAGGVERPDPGPFGLVGGQRTAGHGGLTVRHDGRSGARDGGRFRVRLWRGDHYDEVGSFATELEARRALQAARKERVA